MKELEKKFLNKLYDDMLQNKIINNNNPKDRDQKIKEVTDYLDKLKRVETLVINKKRVDLLKKYYYNKYVIKEENIPNKVYEINAKVLLRKGFGEVNLNNETKHKFALNIIDNQKKSLDRILNYFFSNDSKYFSYELKYWAFQSILKMSNYDKEKKTFNRRSNKTVSPFIDINLEALSLSIDTMQKYLNNQKFDNKLIEYLDKANFSKIYAYYINQIEEININRKNTTKGKWIKYNKGTDANLLVNSLIGKNTNWCSVSLTTAQMQLDDGNMYIYYTLDKNNQYTIPRLCIRMEDNTIAEVRGILPHQHIELDLIEIIDKKLQEFSDYKKYDKKINDSYLLKTIYDKTKKNIELSIEELKFLYEVGNNITGFGYFKNPNIEIIKKMRNYSIDMNKLLENNNKKIK